MHTRPSQSRKIGPTRRSVSGIHAFRGETAIPYESTLERDFLIRREFSLAVLDVIPQPCQIPFVAGNGQSYVYTPDFLVYYRLGDMPYPQYPKPLLVEVKPRSEWKKHWREWLPKWKAAYRHAQEQGWEFHIHDESRIRDQILANILFLDRYKRIAVPEVESAWVIDNLRQMGSAPMHYLLARHFMGHYRAEGIAHLWHLLAVRRLECDLNYPLSENTEFWVPSHE